MRLISASVAVATAAAGAPPVDRWLLDGHGVGRALFGASGNPDGWLLESPKSGCTQLSFYTPFSSYTVNAGMGVRDASGQSPLLAVPLMCGSNGAASMWVVDPLKGSTIKFGALSGVQSIDSYVKFLPDGTVAVGTSGNAVTVYDAESLQEVYRNTAIVAGGGGAQVLAVTKGSSTVPQQLQVAGGTGGPDWWGAAGNLPSQGNSFPFSSVQSNGDSTVNMGGCGSCKRTMRDNKRALFCDDVCCLVITAV